MAPLDQAAGCDSAALHPATRKPSPGGRWPRICGGVAKFSPEFIDFFEAGPAASQAEGKRVAEVGDVIGSSESWVVFDHTTG